MREAPVNPLVMDTATPAIPEARGWLQSYDGAFGPAIDLSQAAPAHAPPEAMLAQLAQAAGDAEAARYGAILGDSDLREAYADHLHALYGGRIEADEVAITAGCNQAFFIAVMALARAGDAVLLPSPWYFNHKMTLDMLGVEARPLPCSPDTGFVPDVAAAERLIDRRVRAIVLVTPNNPTGAVYPEEVVENFRRLCRRRGIWLILDETYRDFLPEGSSRPHRVFAHESWRESVIGLYSFSKSYAVPGHRLGAMLYPARLGPQVTKIQDCVQICAARAGQSALAWGIGALAAWREANRASINRRGTAFREAMRAVPGWRVEQVGAYFAYLRHPFPGAPAAFVAGRLAAERGLLCLPGPYFGPGQEEHMRVAFGNLDETAIQGVPARFEGFDVETTALRQAS